jgi:DNA-binding response OmpR family regulator
MRIAIHSASAAIRRTLEAIIAQAGHHASIDAKTADLLIDDTLNPPQSFISHTTTLRLVALGASENALVCPFRPQSLIQRLTMLGSTQHVPLGNGWTLDMQARILSHNETRLDLTEKECGLLKQLANAYPAALTREDLLEHVWGMTGDIDTHTLETHIYRLRAKLESLTPSACDIVTQNGAYVLVTNN